MSSPNDCGWHTSDFSDPRNYFTFDNSTTSYTQTLERMIYCPIQRDYIPARCCPNICKNKKVECTADK